MDIDLVLSGCGVRVPAHIGAIKALEELDYNIIRICGASGGAIAGGLYATGLSIETLVQEIIRLDFKKLTKFSLMHLLTNFGLYKLDELVKRINYVTGNMTLSQLKRDIYIITTHESNGLVVLNKENYPDMTLGEAVALSSSIPLFFGRRVWGNNPYLDGGLTSNYPIDVLDEQRKVLGLNIRGTRRKFAENENNGLIEHLRRVATTVVEAIEREHVEDAQWAYTIPIVIDNVKTIDFDITERQKRELIDIGYESVMKWHERNS